MSDLIVVWGGGYCGLTGAVHFAKAGKNVLIYDPDQRVVDAINAGKPKAGEFLGYLGGETYGVKATTVKEDVRAASIHIVNVPSEKNDRPYDRIVLEVMEYIRKNCPKGSTIIVESTLTPGTTDKFLGGCGLEGNYIAVCPRRDWFSDPEKNLATLKRIVGGVDEESTRKAVEVLSIVSADIETTDYRTAEITKALENSLLHTQLVLANQLAVSMPDRDVAEALRLASTHWRLIKGLHLNAGAGGRCIPQGLRYLTDAANKAFTIGREINNFEIEMRKEVARAIRRHAKNVKNPKALVLGVAYRPNFRDSGMSPGLDVARHLVTEGFSVGVQDPMWNEEELCKLSGLPVWTSNDWKGFDVIVLTTPHTCWSVPSEFREGQIVFDAQGTWKRYREFCKLLQVKYVQLGTPGWTGE